MTERNVNVYKAHGAWTMQDMHDFEDGVGCERFSATQGGVKVRWRLPQDSSGWWISPLDAKLKENT